MTETVDLAAAGAISRDFSVQYQKVLLDLNFRRRAISGKTEILILPESKDLKTIRLNCRQVKITKVSVEGKTVNLKDIRYADPYECAKPYPSFTVYQHHLLRNRIRPYIEPPTAQELHIQLPQGVRVTNSPPLTLKLFKADTEASELAANEGAGEFTPLNIEIEFEAHAVRDGLHFVGLEDGDIRYPHLWTNNSPYAGKACSLFPCVDETTSRHPWDISIRCPRTLGDAFAAKVSSNGDGTSKESMDIVSKDGSDNDLSSTVGLSEREKALDLLVVCSGNLTDEIVDPSDSTRKTVSFSTPSLASANQIGFAVGPFEDVDLSDFREIDEDEKLGTQAVRIHGYCLPGRAAEVRNTCMPLAKAIDFFTTTFTAYTGDSYKLCFVDDLPSDYVSTAGFSICSSRLLFPEDVLEPLNSSPRTLVDALAAQYSGVALVAREPTDAWLVAGMRTFMTDSFLKHLSGNNEHRFRQKRNSDRVHELDHNRPSLSDLGRILHLDPSETEFMTLKASVVLFILDRRLTKSSGSAGITRIISRFLTTSKGGDADATFISTSMFHQRCQKMGHLPLDTFFEQWVYGAGCPTFQVTQRFNKKRMVVEMLIRQVQGEQQDVVHDLEPATFLRDIKEDEAEVYAGTLPPVFVGPMTIRIHEADGTPYEHIIDIKELNTRFEIPYNTKYKRLGRNKRQRERLAASTGPVGNSEGQDDVLLYCLGDVLQSQEEVAEWRLTDWSKEDEDRMNQESYEWIRMDADFEWICKLNINMPAYMFVSQLQQDRDVVAQMETLQYIAAQKGHPLISTILTRTVMDRRYFHGIRTMAAAGLIKCATEECDWIGMFHLEKIFQEMFCVPNSAMMRPNDFSHRPSYFLQCAIPKALGRIKDNAGEAPASIKRFFLDKLKFNDNSENEYNDNHYMSALLSGLAEALADGKGLDSFDEDADRDTTRKDAMNEIERYRRIDEWIASFQNVYSVTALDCLLKLAKGKVWQPRLKDFLQYTQSGNGDNIRLKAFECLIELGMLRSDPLLKYFIYTLASDPSAYFRHHAYHILGRGLASIAMGEKRQNTEPQPTDLLVIEQEGSTEARKLELERRQSVPAALEALKAELGNNKAVRDALWAAVQSPVTNLDEINNFLELCSYLYEPEDKLQIKLRYPRYWQAKHIGKAVVVFKRTTKVRTKLTPPLRIRQEEPVFAAPAPAVTKIKLGISLPKAESPQAPTTPLSLKPPKPVKALAVPKATPPPPKPAIPATQPKVATSAPRPSPVPPAPNGASAQTSTAFKPSPSPAIPRAPSAESTKATPVPRQSHIVILKIRRDRLGKWPSGAKGPKPFSAHVNGHNGAASRAATPTISFKPKTAMSPPPLSTAGNPPAAKKQKTSQNPAPKAANSRTSASPAPPSGIPKKRKNTIDGSGTAASASQEPPAKRPILKLKLGLGKLNGGAGPPPT